MRKNAYFDSIYFIVLDIKEEEKLAAKYKPENKDKTETSSALSFAGEGERGVEDEELLRELSEAGAHLAFSRSRRHPSVKEFVFGKKGRNDVIDLEKTRVQLASAEAFVEECGRLGKKILFVGTKPEARMILRECAERVDAPFMLTRWIGGLLSNFSEIKKRLARLEELSTQKGSEAAEKYTKKEQGRFEKELEDLLKKFEGVRALTAPPDVLFIVDPRYEVIACREATLMKIPLVALAGSDCDINGILYPVVANDGGVQSIRFFVGRIGSALKRGREGKV